MKLLLKEYVKVKTTLVEGIDLWQNDNNVYYNFCEFFFTLLYQNSPEIFDFWFEIEKNDEMYKKYQAFR